MNAYYITCPYRFTQHIGDVYEVVIISEDMEHAKEWAKYQFFRVPENFIEITEFPVDKPTIVMQNVAGLWPTEELGIPELNFQQHRDEERYQKEKSAESNQDW